MYLLLEKIKQISLIQDYKMYFDGVTSNKEKFKS